MDKTILVFDIRNFTSISHKEDNETLAKYMAKILEKIITNCMSYNGELINFTGDGLIYSFDCTREAILVSSEIRNIIKKFNKEAHSNKQFIIQFGIGLHKGDYASENLFINNKNYSITIGDGINLASKIESYTRKYHVDILVDEEIVKEVKNKFNFLTMPPIKINGIKKELNVYWLAPINKEKK